MRNQLLGNRYRVLDRIGEGGMAFVYLARDEKLGRKVAVKVLHEHMEKNPDIRKRFQMEAQAVSSLDHPNIVRIYDFSGASDAGASDSAGRLWIVTEVIRGQNLAQYVQQFTGGWLHPVIASCIVREICKALGAAHAQGIVHRDVKPENVMLTHEGRVKLMDFGIAKDTGKASMTITGTFMGSPSYMSPEQIRGRDVDHRSDLYSLAVLFYEVVTGRLPFSGNTTHDVVLKIMEGQFTHPRFIVPSLPDRLNDLVVRGMARDPDKRFSTAQAFGAELDDFLAKAGFDESHIELERYFSDRQAYEQRLAKTAFASTNTSVGLRNKRPALATIGPGAQQSQPHTSAQWAARQATKHLPSPPPFKADDTWQRRLAQAKTMREAPAQAKPPPPPSAIREARPTRVMTQALVQQQATQAHYAAAYAAIDSSNPKRSPGYASPRQRGRPRRAAGRRSKQGLARDQTSTLTSYVLGAALVALFGAISIWGFWELQSRLAAANKLQSVLPVSNANINSPEQKVRQRRNGTPSVIKHSSKPKLDQAPVAAANVEQRDRQESLSKTGTEKKGKRRPRRSSPTIAQALPPIDSGDANLTIEAAELKKNRGNSARTTKLTVPASTEAPSAQAVSQSPTPTAKDQPATPASSAPPNSTPSIGKILISSEPAAEIYLDGRRLGTTIDATVNSGWLAVSAGSHVLQLKRQGYKAHKIRIDVQPGEQKSLPKVELEAAKQADPRNTLTLRVSLYPAQVTIRNLDKSVTQAFTMKASTRVLQLESGRYQVRIEHKGEAKERDVNLNGSEQLTFTADFKGED